MSDWKPSAPIEHLKARAELLASIRQFFAARDVLEVETPALSQFTVTDRYMRSIPATVSKTAKGYLQTSPEYAMKRLLAAGSGSIYQLAKAFRQDEVGNRHNPEFTLLEWYRVGFDDHQLMDEVHELLVTVLGARQRQDVSYQEAFVQFLDIDPLQITDAELESMARQQLGELPTDLERDDFLSLLFEDQIEPRLGKEGRITFIYNYPASQAALARVCESDPRVAHRFEVYVDGVELANGFYELSDPQQQLARFEADNRWRQANGLPEIAIDQRLIDALANGLPDCAGVALGVDRLLMLQLNAASLAEVIAFPWDRA